MQTHPYLVQGWNPFATGAWSGRGGERMRMHTIEWDGTDESWPRVRDMITDKYLMTRVRTGQGTMVEMKDGRELLMSYNDMFSDMKAAFQRSKAYWQERVEAASQKFVGGKRLRDMRLREHWAKHAMRYNALREFLSGRTSAIREELRRYRAMRGDEGGERENEDTDGLDELYKNIKDLESDTNGLIVTWPTQTVALTADVGLSQSERERERSLLQSWANT